MNRTYQKADLHIHTNNSDGIYDLSYIKNIVYKDDIAKVLSITDHNYLTLEESFIENNVLWIPGIEVSAMIIGDGVHITGYSLKPNLSPRFQEMLTKIMKGYTQRAKIIYDRLVQRGLSLPAFENLREVDRPSPISKVELAMYLSKALGLNDIEKARNWAKKNGNLFHVEGENYIPDITDVIAGMKESGFTIFWAHPGRKHFLPDISDPKSNTILKALMDLGIDGLEVYAYRNNPMQRSYLLDIAQKYGLIVSGGSDFHGSDGRGIDYPMNIDYLNSFLKGIGF